MKRTAAFIALWGVLAAGTAQADTFAPRPIAPEAGVDVFHRDAAQRTLGRDLMSNPYSSIVLARVDVYDAFPYVEARYFQVVADPGWNRLLTGETERGFTAFDGADTGFGALSEPRGLVLGREGTFYLADTGNDRVLEFRAVTEYDRIQLVPVRAFEGLARPYDVAFSDGGTPEEPGDDRLYVADTGRNRVVRFSLGADQPRIDREIGALGSGPGAFAGPMAIAAGRTDGAGDGTLFVADAHNRRIVRLVDGPSGFQWSGESMQDFDVITGLETDHWGHLYATGPGRATVVKLTRDFVPLDELPTAVERPRDFHVLVADVHDHTRGTTHRAGQDHGVLVESWSRGSGLRLWQLGADVRDVSVSSRDGVATAFRLTHPARVTAEISDPGSGMVIARHDAGLLESGAREVAFAPEDFLADLGEREYVLRLNAVPESDQASPASVDTRFTANGTDYPNVTRRPLFLGNRPNPFTASTTIQFVIPDGNPVPTRVDVFDLQGRLVRTVVDEALAPGAVALPFDGRDARGRELPAGIYLYRVNVGESRFTEKMILVR